MKKEFIDIVKKILEKSQRIGFVLLDEKDIDYGVQLTFGKNGKKIKLNVYFSEKKGYSFVFLKSDDSTEKRLLESIIDYIKQSQKTTEHHFDKWLGTDESGKGDFFGALCVAGFVASKRNIEKLKQAHIADSKTLNDDMIEKKAKYLYMNFKDSIQVIVLTPTKYNDLYEKFSLQKKKLNHILAWMHGRIIVDLYKKHHFETAIIDKFVDKKVIVASLRDLKNIKLIVRTKAESDLAVASASIIARYHFIQSIRFLEKKYNMKFPKGASDKVIEAAREFSKKYGKERLKEVAKIHFKTYENI